jgi:hypothetical protein
MGSVVSPKEYYDWWFFSGVRLGDPTRPANYAALREQLSAPGLALIVLWDLLLGVEGSAETAYAGYQQIHGAAARMAEAARAVGAERLATWLSTLPDPTVVPETHAELKSLLKRFAVRHKAELAADITRLGDPRAAPGFDRRRARRERETEWGQNNARYQIADRVPFFAAPLEELRSYLARGMTLEEISRQSDEMAGFACCLRFDVPRWASSPQPPEVTLFLEECRQLFEQYPAQLPPWGSEG